jgi:hypothetical protein
MALLSLWEGCNLVAHDQAQTRCDPKYPYAKTNNHLICCIAIKHHRMRAVSFSVGLRRSVIMTA